MNRFLNKKKTTDDSSSPLSPPSTGRKWKKNNSVKKEVVEPKPQIDLGTVLPSTEEFRTSLIMPNLSARFSMLREQDDPKSKLGKASDDSVLQPQRNSRLLDFGFSSGGLNDIAEVASINSSIQRPFALDRHVSYASEDGYGTDNDSSHANSVMSRARPGEGNVLFGGRQKVYKVPTGSAKSIGGGSERGMGRILYDDDVSMSAFQKYRQQERDRMVAAGADFDSDSAPMSPDTDPGHRVSEEDQPKGLGLTNADPGFVFDNRHSDSTTNSIPSQDASTAATSVNSQPIGTAITTFSATAKTSPNPAGPGLERSLTKRRLYEQGLNQHMYEQQNSALTRLNSIQQQRAPTVGSLPPSLSHSKSIGNLHDRGAYKPYALQNPGSPPLKSGQPGALALNTLVGSNVSNTSSPIVASFPQSPINPESEEYQVLSSALEPADRGKATAMGAFNKPAQQFNEQQYLKLQMQMDHSKDSISRGSSPNVPSVEPDATFHSQPEPTPTNKILTRELSTSRQVSAESTSQESRLARFDSPRQNSISQASQRSRSRSVSKSATEEPANKAFAVFQNAASKNRVVHGESPVQTAIAAFDGHRTFFGDIETSDDEDDEQEEAGSGFDSSVSSSHGGRYAGNALSSVWEHPALRNDDIPEVDEEAEERLAATLPNIDPTALQVQVGAAKVDPPEIDSPTIGTHEALGGLIHQHLRNTSNVSSIYPLGLPGSGDDDAYAIKNSYSGSNAWDLDELDNYYGELGSRRISAFEDLGSKGQAFAPAPLITHASPERSSTSEEPDLVDSVQWQNDFRKQHTRDASTATQAERAAFDNELAARQKAIQEKMKSIVESESRGTSPGPSAGGALKAFGMLKTKPSHETMSGRQDAFGASSKATKMLGLGLTGAQSQSYDDRIPQPANAGGQWPLPGPSASPLSQADSDTSTRTPNTQIYPHPALRDRSRTRSNSEASTARSRSHSVRQDAIPGVPSVMPPQRPSPEVNQFRSASSEGRGRMRSNSRVTGLHPSGRGTPNGSSPAHSPAGFSSQGSTPRQIMSPPMSANTTPAARPPFHKSNSSPMPSVSLGKARGELLRKKTINKADISEPTLVSSTSNIDTVDLPAGASLQNGMAEIYAAQPPSVSARRRKLFGFSRESSSEDMRGKYGEGVTPPPLSVLTSPPMQRAMPSYRSASQEQRKPSINETGSIYPQTIRSQDSFETQAGSARFDAVGSPVLNEAGMF